MKEFTAVRCIKITGSDDRMDCRDMFRGPVNTLPQLCAKCGFPDLDYVPQPYFLVKSRTMSPNELAPAENGNLLIRDRVRKVLEMLAPSQCTYYPTNYKGTVQQTPWFLTVPMQQIITAKVNPSIPRCEQCGEPQSAHPGTQWSERLFGTSRRNPPPNVTGWTGDSSFEILKSSTWGSSEKSWRIWISRDCFMSVRLFHLFKKIKAKGLYEATCQKPISPNKDESAWIKEKLKLLNEANIPFHAEGTLSAEVASWFRKYVKTRAIGAEFKWDSKAVERRLKAKLPKTYVDFMSAVGPVSFHNIDEQKGFTAMMLAPAALKIENCADKLEDDESKSVNQLMFAKTEHGDNFCFDIQKGKKEYSVYHYKHEYNYFEPYAESFAECVRRFVGE